MLIFIFRILKLNILASIILYENYVWFALVDRV